MCQSAFYLVLTGLRYTVKVECAIKHLILQISRSRQTAVNTPFAYTSNVHLNVLILPFKL